MIHIPKLPEAPAEYNEWYLEHKEDSWEHIDLPKKNVLRNIVLSEQGFVCCFCGSNIGKTDNTSSETIVLQHPVASKEHNIRMAHIDPRSKCLCSQLDYTNICASCDAEGKQFSHCDFSQDDCKLPISPLQEECLSYFRFDNVLGIIKPNPKRTTEEQNQAKETIKILNLNSDNLISKRITTMKVIDEEFDSIFEEIGDETDDTKEQDNKYQTLYTKLTTKNSAGAYNEFYFIVIAQY